MVALAVLVVLLVALGAGGIALHLLWWLLLVAVALWVLGFFVGGVDAGMGGRRRWYGRW